MIVLNVGCCDGCIMSSFVTMGVFKQVVLYYVGIIFLLIERKSGNGKTFVKMFVMPFW